jgi:hypothetical protein
LFFQYFIIRSDKELTLRADKNQYSDDELTEIKMPLNLPYMTSSSGYERVDGEVTINGIYYNYVKRKVYNDTLYLMCLPNKDKTKFYSSRNDYANKVQDVPVNGKNSDASGKKLLLASEYNQPAVQFILQIPFLIRSRKSKPADTGILYSFLNETFHPPRITCS